MERVGGLQHDVGETQHEVPEFQEAGIGLGDQ